MSIEKFTEIVRENLQKKTGKEVVARAVTKNNGKIFHGISIVEPESNMIPVIYMESYIDAYRANEDIEVITEQIIDVHEKECKQLNFDIKWFMDFNKVKKKLVYKLINYNSNKEILQDVPHEKILDLVKVYYINFDEQKYLSGTILIHNKHLEVWGITEEQLKAVAEENTPKVLPAKIMNIARLISELTEDDFEFEQRFSDDCNLFVATNHIKNYGAAVMCYTNIFKEFAEHVNSDLYILPSSVHELIIVVPTGNESITAFKEMVKCVNRTELKVEEILSDSVYIYMRDTNKITVV